MPLFEFKCSDCNKSCELLIMGSSDQPKCPYCGSLGMAKIISAHSAASGPSKSTMPGPGDTACCGSSPGMAEGCKGLGSCCGKSFGE